MVVKALAILGFFVLLIIGLYVWLFHWLPAEIFGENDE